MSTIFSSLFSGSSPKSSGSTTKHKEDTLRFFQLCISASYQGVNGLYKHKGISMRERSFIHAIVRCTNRIVSHARTHRPGLFACAKCRRYFLNGVGIYATTQCTENRVNNTADHFKYYVHYISRQYFYYISISSTAIIVCT